MLALSLEAAAERFRDTLQGEAAAQHGGACHPSSKQGAQPDVFEIAGAIRWFDASKGYGFIVPDNGIQDVLIGVHDLRDGVDPSQLSAGDTNMAVAESHWEMASVSSFDPEQGFGFVSLGSQAPPIYCHIETVRRFGFTELRPGQRVQIRWGHRENGPTVVEMRPGNERHR